jgi:hypothetical protein
MEVSVWRKNARTGRDELEQIDVPELRGQERTGGIAAHLAAFDGISVDAGMESVLHCLRIREFRLALATALWNVESRSLTDIIREGL